MKSAATKLLELPFDQYQRYKVAADLLALLGVPRGERVLDVGGAPGPIERFLPDHTAYVVDIEGARAGRYACASGASLPFPSGSFAVAFALDTLEHVPPPERRGVLAEMRRVADVVILSAPFADPQVELAEAALHEFITQRFGGDFPTLEEHSLHGLPRLHDTVQEFAGAEWATATLPSGYLPRWLIGMLVHHEILATGVPQLLRLHAYYNETVSPFDCREPSYRHVILAARDLPEAALEAATAKLRVEADTAGSDAALTSIVSAVFSQRLGGILRSGEVAALQAEADRLDDLVQDLERQLADRDAHVNGLRASNEHLQRSTENLQREIERLSRTMLEHANGTIPRKIMRRAARFLERRTD